MPPHMPNEWQHSSEGYKSLQVHANIAPHSGAFPQITPCLSITQAQVGRSSPNVQHALEIFQTPQQIDTHHTSDTTHAWPPPQHLSQPLERRPQSTPAQGKSWRPQSCACGAWRRCADAWLPMWPRALWLAFRGGAAVGQSPGRVPPPPTHTHTHTHNVLHCSTCAHPAALQIRTCVHVGANLYVVNLEGSLRWGTVSALSPRSLLTAPILMSEARAPHAGPPCVLLK